MILQEPEQEEHGIALFSNTDTLELLSTKGTRYPWQARSLNSEAELPETLSEQPF